MEEEKKEISTAVGKREEEDFNEYGEAKVPEVGEPTCDFMLPNLKSRQALIKILSYLPIKDLVASTKLNRFAFKFILDEENRKSILSWDLDKTEETRINNYLISLIQTTDEKE